MRSWARIPRLPLGSARVAVDAGPSAPPASGSVPRCPAGPLSASRSDAAEASVLIDMLAGVVRPAYGELRVLGQDMASARGRAAVRRRVGVARRAARQPPGIRIRGLVEHAARLAVPDSGDRRLLAAGILDRLALSPWAEVSVRLAPDAIARRARLAAAAVHQPELLLLDGLLDELSRRDAAVLAEHVRDLGRDCGVVVAGCDYGALALACDDIMTMVDGVLVSG